MTEDRMRAAMDAAARRTREAVEAGSQGRSGSEDLLPQLAIYRRDYEQTRARILQRRSGAAVASAESPTPLAWLLACRLLSHLRHGLAESSLHRVSLLAGRVAQDAEPNTADLLSRAVMGISESVREVEQFLAERPGGVAMRDLIGEGGSGVEAELARVQRAGEAFAQQRSATAAAELAAAARELLAAFEGVRRGFDRHRTDLRLVLGEVVARERARFEDAGVPLVLDLSDKAPARLFVDSASIERALGELLRNAARYTAPAAGARCTVRLESGGSLGEQLRIVIENAPVASAAPTATERSSTGEGLVLVRRAVTEHAGELETRVEGGCHRAVVMLPRR